MLEATSVTIKVEAEATLEVRKVGGIKSGKKATLVQDGKSELNEGRETGEVVAKVGKGGDAEITTNGRKGSSRGGRSEGRRQERLGGVRKIGRQENIGERASFQKIGDEMECGGTLRKRREGEGEGGGSTRFERKTRGAGNGDAEIGEVQGHNDGGGEVDRKEEDIHRERLGEG